MKFNKIISNQIILNQIISKARKNEFVQAEEKNTMRILALLTELGELANEVQSFKYWKNSKKIEREEMMEEYADGLHFLVSLALIEKQDNWDDVEIMPIVKFQDINEQFIYMFELVVNLKKNSSLDLVFEAIGAYLGIAHLLGMNDEDIQSSYDKKNKKNIERIKNNY